jgi:hypothetical protein
MKRAAALLPLALVVGLTYFAYLNPVNVWRWTALMNLCQ